MECKRIAVITLAVISLVGSSTLTWAADGAQLFKSKCAGCHGASGEGKPAMKAPAIKGTSMDADKLAEFLTKGDSAHKTPHSKPVSGVNDEQAKAIAEFVKTLK